MTSLFLFFLDETALNALEIPLNLTDVEIISRGSDTYTKVSFTGDLCNGAFNFLLRSSGDTVDPGKFYWINKGTMENGNIPDPTSTNIYTLKRQLHGSQIGPTSDFTYTPPTTT